MYFDVLRNSIIGEDIGTQHKDDNGDGDETDMGSSLVLDDWELAEPLDERRTMIHEENHSVDTIDTAEIPEEENENVEKILLQKTKTVENVDAKKTSDELFTLPTLTDTKSTDDEHIESNIHTNAGAVRTDSGVYEPPSDVATNLFDSVCTVSSRDVDTEKVDGENTGHYHDEVISTPAGACSKPPDSVCTVPFVNVDTVVMDSVNTGLSDEEEKISAVATDIKISEQMEGADDIGTNTTADFDVDEQASMAEDANTQDVDNTERNRGDVRVYSEPHGVENTLYEDDNKTKKAAAVKLKTTARSGNKSKKGKSRRHQNTSGYAGQPSMRPHKLDE